MLLILEVILTVVAWRKGWHWRALLPLAVGLLVMFWMGIACGAAGLSRIEIHRIAVFMGFFEDLAIIGILIWMAMKDRGNKSSVSEQIMGVKPDVVPQAGSQLVS